MDNPTLNTDDKLGLIKAAVGGKPSAEFVRFIELVVKNKREVFLRNIVAYLGSAHCVLLCIDFYKVGAFWRFAEPGLSGSDHHAIPRRKANEIADQFIKALGIRTPSREQRIGNLSGGNQQKVIIARWLAVHPRLLILDEPTRGIDVGAPEIEELIQKLREEGMSLLLISSELDEVVRNSSRVVVLRDRDKIAELTGEDLSEQKILRVIASQAAGEVGA